MELSVVGVRFGIFFCWRVMLNTADGDTPEAKPCRSTRKKTTEQNSGLVFRVFGHDNPLSLFLHLTPPYPKE